MKTFCLFVSLLLTVACGMSCGDSATTPPDAAGSYSCCISGQLFTCATVEALSACQQQKVAGTCIASAATCPTTQAN